MNLQNLIFLFFYLYKNTSCEIRSSALINKLRTVKPVGGHADKYLALTELPQLKPSRRHMQDCRYLPANRPAVDGPNIHIEGDYYDDQLEKKMYTVKMPDHIDRKHFEITTQPPYFTVGTIEGIGYHPTTKRISECEKIYIDHMAEDYSDEWTDQSEESMEMAKMPIHGERILAEEYNPYKIYEELIEK